MVAARRNHTTELRTYPIRLAHAYLQEAKVERQVFEDPAERSQSIDPSIRVVSYAPDGKGFSLALGVVLTFPFREAAQLRIDCSVSGVFASEDQHSKGDFEAFANREAVALLWPYLRAYVAQLVQFTGLDVPPLPTLDVGHLVGALDEAKQRRSGAKRRPAAPSARGPGRREAVEGPAPAQRR